MTQTAAAPAGYSGTPLAKKLGIKPASRLLVMAAPDGYAGLLAPLPDGVVFVDKLSDRPDIVHLFATRKVDLRVALGALRTALPSDAVIWVSWPKKASKVSSDIDDNVIRELALPLEFVDVKVCAVSAVWSGLKLVVRKAAR